MLLSFAMRDPRVPGMPEMFYTTEAIASDPELGASIA